MTAVAVSKARASLPQLLERVGSGEEITLTRHGAAVAVLVHPDALRSRRTSAATETAVRLGDALDAARSAPMPTTGLSAARAEELIGELRAERAAS